MSRGKKKKTKFHAVAISNFQSHWNNTWTLHISTKNPHLRQLCLTQLSNHLHLFMNNLIHYQSRPSPRVFYQELCSWKHWPKHLQLFLYPIQVHQAHHLHFTKHWLLQDLRDCHVLYSVQLWLWARIWWLMEIHWMPRVSILLGWLCTWLLMVNHQSCLFLKEEWHQLHYQDWLFLMLHCMGESFSGAREAHSNSRKE